MKRFITYDIDSIYRRDVLVFLNEKNLLKPPISIRNDQIKSEFTSLRRHNKPIRIGICRSSDRSLFNTNTIQHLGSLTLDEFQKLTTDDSSLNGSRKSVAIVDEIITNVDTKKYLNNNKLSIQKRSASPNRDSGFIETDGTNTSVLTDRSVISNNKRRSKISLEKSEDGSMDTHKSLDSLQHSISKTTIEQTKNKQSGLIYSKQGRDKNRRTQVDLPSQTVTDACFIYRRQVIKEDANDEEKAAIILRGRQIAYEAANAPAIPTVMPNYTRDQIRELYGELDKKTHYLQQEEYTLHSPITNEKRQWKLASPTKSKIIDECPLPKFHIDKTPDNDETLLMAAYLSTGLTNAHTKAVAPVDNFHTIMMNASAKVNEWANNNEIYLTPVENRPVVTDSTPLLLDVQFNLKQLAAGTPTGNSDRPTFLGGIQQQNQQQVTSHPDQAFSNRESRGSIRRQQNMLDTASSSPDSVDIALETTPSTPGSCGMYLEPYMRHGYDLPSVDHHVRDSSWQHADNDDNEESLRSMKNITPIESPLTPQFDTNIVPLSTMNSQIIDTESLIDLDDGTTGSYHTAKESRLDNGRQSTISTGSDETSSTLHQPIVRDDLINNVTSPTESFYYDALPSPSQTNQQISSVSDKQNLLIDNLTNLLEEIETFNRTNRQSLTTIDEEKPRLPPEGEESTHNIHKLITIVDDIHQFHEIKPYNAMDNLLFVYDDDMEQDEEQENLSIDHLVEIVRSIHQIPSCVENLLFMYDDTITPTDGESKPIVNDSDEWSYDNLATEQEEQVDTDHLGTIIHEALAARFQKPIKFKETDVNKEPTIDTDNLDMVVHEILETNVQKPWDEIYEPEVETDHLGTIIHEALAARFQKPMRFKEIDEVKEPVINTDNLDSVVHEVLATPLQQPTEQTTDEIFEVDIETDNLGTITHEALAARFQKPIKTRSVIEDEDEVFQEKSEEFINESPIQYSVPSISERPIEERSDDDLISETVTYEIETSLIPPPVSNLSRIVSDSLLTSSNYHHHHHHHQSHQDDNTIEFNITHKPPYDEEIFEEYGYRRTTTDPESEDVVDKFEELYQRYTSTLDQYDSTAKKFDDDINQFEKRFHEQKEQITTPVSDTTSEELITTIERVIDMSDESSRKRNDTDDFTSTLTVKRQANSFGKYGFNFEEYSDRKIQVTSIIDENYCPNLNIGDEIVSINNNRSFKTYEQCQALFDSLWKDFYENVQITVIKSANIPTTQTSEPVSLQSSSLSWPLSIVESGRILNNFLLLFIDLRALDIA